MQSFLYAHANVNCVVCIYQNFIELKLFVFVRMLKSIKVTILANDDSFVI